MTFGPDGQQHQSRSDAEAQRCTTEPQLITFHRHSNRTAYWPVLLLSPSPSACVSQDEPADSHAVCEFVSAETEQAQPQPLLAAGGGRRTVLLRAGLQRWHTAKVSRLSSGSLPTHAFVSSSVICSLLFIRASKLQISCQKGLGGRRMRWCRIILLN